MPQLQKRAINRKSKRSRQRKFNPIPMRRRDGMLGRPIPEQIVAQMPDAKRNLAQRGFFEIIYDSFEKEM